MDSYPTLITVSTYLYFPNLGIYKLHVDLQMFIVVVWQEYVSPQELIWSVHGQRQKQKYSE